MLPIVIPNPEEELQALRDVAPAGFILAFNMTFRGPEHMHTEYPDGWRAEYEEKNYFAGDPILLWTLMSTGYKRWSEIDKVDIRGILKKAMKYGLNYGTVFAVKRGRKRSFLTVARPDRELTDAENGLLDAKFTLWCELVTNRASLSLKEIEVLRLFRDGYAQREIAEALSISEATVKQRALKCMSKLQSTTRTQAVAVAMTRGYLD